MTEPTVATLSSETALLGESFISQFLPNFAATIIGIVLGGIVTIAIALWQIRLQTKKNYVSTLKSLFSELQDSERVFRQGKSFNLKIGTKEYKLLLFLLNRSALSGSLSSERLGFLGNHKLISSLTAVERKITLHNHLVVTLMNSLSSHDWSTQAQTGVFDWLYKNLNEKQKILIDDFKRMMQVLATEIQLNSKKSEFIKYCGENKKVEESLKNQYKK